MGDLIEFSEAKQFLQMEDAELQGLVTKGELRAFRSGGTMKFKRADVENFKRERETEPTIIIPAEQQAASVPAPIEAPPTEALQIGLPDDFGIDESAATVVPESTDTGTEEIVFDDSDLEILPVDDEAASAVTSEITVQEVAVGAAVEETVSVADDDIEVEDDLDEAPRRRGSERMSSVPSRRVSAAYEAAPGSPIFSALLILSAAALIFIGSVFGVMLWKGYGADKEGEWVRYVPNYLEGTYESMKDVGNPQ